MTNHILNLFLVLTLFLSAVVQAQPPKTITKDMLLTKSYGYFVEDSDEKGTFWKLHISPDIDVDMVNSVIKRYKHSLKPLTLIELVDGKASYAEGNPEREHLGVHRTPYPHRGGGVQGVWRNGQPRAALGSRWRSRG